MTTLRSIAGWALVSVVITIIGFWVLCLWSTAYAILV